MKLDIQLTLKIQKNWLPDILEALNTGNSFPEIPYDIIINQIPCMFNIGIWGYDVVINTKDPVLVQRVVDVVNSFMEVKNDE